MSYTSIRKKNRIKAVALILSLALLCGVAVGGTVALLRDADASRNTFTLGEVAIALNESEAEYKMIPGVPIDKDPSITVDPSSSDCWLFAKLTPSDNFAEYMAFAPNTENWTPLATSDGSVLLYMLVDTPEEKNVPFSLLAGDYIADGNVIYTWEDDQVLVLPSVTKAMMDEAEGSEPTLTVSAYAIQAAGFDNVDDAWAAMQQSLS